MRAVLLSLLLTILLTLALTMSAAAAYVPVTFNGVTYNYCDHVRPGSANWYAAGCDAP